jgi:subtilisin family serine protease
MKNITLLLAFAIALPLAANAPQKKRIETANDLPRRTYTLKGTALEILEDRAQLAQLTGELLKNMQSDLETYDIRDNATLNGYYGLLMILHASRGEYDRALAYVPKIRELESKKAAKLTAGLFVDTLAKAKREVPDQSSAAFRAAFAKHYAAAYAALPYEDIAELVEQSKGQLVMLNRELILGSVQGNLQQVLDNTKGVVPEGVVAGFISTRFVLDHRLPLKEEMLSVMNALHEAKSKTITRKDIWTARDVTLTADRKLTPVVAGVWDSSVDPSALPEIHRWVNAKETVDGKDNDGNGHVDDVHGIGYDLIDYKKSIGTLDDPKGKVKSDVKRLQALTKGFLDLQSSISSPESAELQKTLSTLKAEQVKEFMEELGFYNLYFHGTHVAGIVAAGNPAVKIVGARMSYNYKLPPAYTMEKAQFMAQMYRDTVDYFKKANARVVNMSWRYNSASIEGTLTINGVGRDEKERKELARKMFEVERNALYEAIKNAPGILFVCGSGNEDNDANFSEYIPASFELPNLITVGAVDSEGKKAPFTTEGKSVDFYANGYEVESYVPGGDRMKVSGTSMASPQVANLAAKLLALHPQLTPAQLIALIGKGAEPSSEDPKIKLIHPAKSLTLAQAN